MTVRDADVRVADDRERREADDARSALPCA